MDLEQFYNNNDPWPSRESSQVLFILDTRNRTDEQLLSGWIHHYTPDGREEFQAPQISINLRDESKDADYGQLVMALALPPETLVVPLRVTWLPGENETGYRLTLRRALLGDPRKPGDRRARQIIAKYPERVHLMRGAPDTVGNLFRRFEQHYTVDSAASQKEFAGFVARQAAIVLDIADRQLKGSRYKVPRHVAATLKASPAFIQAIDEQAEARGKTREEILEEATEYMEEMVSFPNSFWLDIYARFNNFCLGLGYEKNVIVDRAAIARTRELVRNYPAMLLWTHKTYLDGMVVPKVLYDNDFPMPHMFGGANMNFPGLGFLLHRAGAIFIKRSFRDNELYKTTLRHYIGYLMEKRFPMTWSFEGTRSRLGKLMPPRYGLLKYVLEACHASDARNIHIIPVSISYDMIRDVEEYASEQTGRNKKPESLSWFVGYIRSLARPMGKVYMDIGEPVILPQAPEPGDGLALSKIAFEVAVEANKVTPITFPSLVTMSLLGAAPKAMTEAELVAELNSYLSYAESRNLRISPDFDRSFADQMEGLLGIMIAENIVTRYDEGPEVVYGIGLNQHPVASYYRNTIIHFFVNKAIIELAMVRAKEFRGEQSLEVFWREVDYLRDLFKFEFFYAPTEEFHRQIRDELALYSPDWESMLSEETFGFGRMLEGMTPLVAHVTLLTYAEAYSVVASLLARMDAEQSLEESTCVSEALKYGRQIYLQRRISSESSIGKLLFKNGYQMLSSRGLVEGGGAEVKEKRLEVARELRELLRRIDLIRAIDVGKLGLQV